MERQLRLILETSEERHTKLRHYLRPLKLPQRQVDLLCLLAGHGERISDGGQHFSRLQINQREAASKMECSKNTFAEAVLDLHAMEVLGVLHNSTPRTYAVNWNRVAKLQPPPPEPELPEFIKGEIWSPPGQALVSAGQGPRDSERVTSLEVRDRASRDNVTRARGERGAGRGAPGESDQPTGDPLTHPRPWMILGDEHLRGAVLHGKYPGLLWRLYTEAVGLGWIDDSEDAKVRFLTICHHCATTAGAHRRVGMLIKRCQRKLDVAKIRHDSEDWASRRLKTPEPQEAR